MDKLSKCVGNKKVCYGCGMCANVCPTEALSIIRDKNGFYTPRLTAPQACTDCGLCSKICNYAKTDSPQYSTPIKSIAAWSNDKRIRNLCSSGGVAFEILREFVRKGYKICAVRYNPENQSAEHFVTEKSTELIQSCGSKYLQSNTVKAFSEIDLNEKHVIIGTPCQIDMWRRYIRLRRKEDNFILVDFFCHGVPSYLVWKKYLAENRNRIRKESMMTWRDKSSGWHSSWNICAYSSNNFGSRVPYYRSSSKKDHDGFYYMFLSNNALNPACYSDCKYKKYHSSADIRLGDYWGEEYANEEKGVSAVLAFTDRGKEVLSQLDITSQTVSPETLTADQISSPLSKPWYYPLCRAALKTNLISLKGIRRIFVISEIGVFQLKKLKRIGV